MIWIYEASETREGKVHHLRQVIYSDTIKESETFADAVLVSPNGERNLYKYEALGVFQVYKSQKQNNSLNQKSTKQLVFPFKHHSGKGWAKTTNIELLEAYGPWEKPLPISGQITMNYLVSNQIKNIHIKDKKFKNCVVLEGYGRGLIDGGDYLKTFEVAIKERLWFAPGVGLIKYARSEQSSDKHISPTKFEMVLKKWEH